MSPQRCSARLVSQQRHPALFHGGNPGGQHGERVLFHPASMTQAARHRGAWIAEYWAFVGAPRRRYASITPHPVPAAKFSTVFRRFAPSSRNRCTANRNRCAAPPTCMCYAGSMKPHSIPIEPSESEIQHAAYHLWLEEGRPANRDLDIWLAARERLKHRIPPMALPAAPPRSAHPSPSDAQAGGRRRR